MINLTLLLKIAFTALIRNKLRTFLTMLGMIIGVGAVITMLAIGQGSRISIQEQVSEMGTNLIMISPASQMMGGVRMDNSSADFLSMEDVESISNSCPSIEWVSPEFRSSGQAIYQSNNAPTTIYGGSEHYCDIKKYEIDEGRMFNQSEVDNSSKICIIGQTVLENLFENETNVIGKKIRLNSIPLKIIGVLTSKGQNNFGQDQDDIIIAPYTTVQKRILAVSYVQSILCSAIDEESSDDATEEITTVLRKNHQLRDDEDDDFTVRSQEELISTFSSVSDVLTILLGVIAGISLLVGGIGIMNIMYVSVSERTREIGLRMALGAPGYQILIQFLTESSILSIMGGIIGILLGFSATTLVTSLFDWPTYITSGSVILAFSVCAILGIFFGWSPARKAAAMNPIEALRYE